MRKPLEGVSVVEVAAWTFVPAAGAVLAEWGADVIKVEHPVGGDPQRGLVAAGIIPSASSGLNYIMELPNHGKRSMAIDIQHPEGHELLLRLCRNADVFLTNWRPAARRKARIDVEDIRAANPSIIYARGSGLGQRGAHAERGAFDGTAMWARAGMVDALTQGEPPWPYGPRQTPAIGDLPGGHMVAGAIAAALFQRERTGEPSVVDMSLLSLGMWMMAPLIMAAEIEGADRMPYYRRSEAPNPIANQYLTKEGRVIHLALMVYDRYAAEFFDAIGRPDLFADPRFATAAVVREHSAELISLLDEIFASRPLVEWEEALADIDGVWDVARYVGEVPDDPQVAANGYMTHIDAPDGSPFPLVSNPVQFDETPIGPCEPAPELGQHTEEILLELGLGWDEIVRLKDAGATL